MKRRRMLYLISQPPGRGALAREMLDALLVGAVFDQEVSVLFVDDGIYQLLGDAQSSHAIARSFTALPTYDVSSIYVASDSLTRRHIKRDALIIAAKPLTRAGVRKLIAAQEVVLND